MEARTINLKNFILQNEIGSGSFGQVYKVKEKRTGRFFAAKIANSKLNENSMDILEDISREVDIISKLSHPSVLKFIGFSPCNFKKKPKPVIITEFVSNGTLEELINSDNCHWNDTQKLITIYGIASALSYLHLHNIIHRDLKPENILMDDFLFPKIADFGFSKITENNEININKNFTISIKGTPIYLSPEIWEKYEYTKAGDVYAFAITVYEILTKEKPFAKFRFFEIPLKVKNGYRPEFKTPIGKSYQNLIERCWSQDLNERPTFDQIVEELKNDRGFITENVNKEEYYKYISFIEECRSSFSSRRRMSFSFHLSAKFNKIMIDQTPIESKFEFKERMAHKIPLFPYNDFASYDDECKSLIEKAQKDDKKLLIVAQNLIECRNNFHQNAKIGMKYLKKALKCDDNEEAFVYYCELLIKGKIIPKNLQKAQKLIKKQTKEYPVLLGKIMKKEKKYEKAKELFEKAIKEGNGEAMYEYGKLLIKGQCEEEGIQYYLNSIKKNFPKAMYKYGLYLLSNGDESKSLEYIKMAANKGCVKAMYQYSLILENRENHSSLDDQEIEFYLRNAANFGHAESMFKYSLILAKKQDNDSKKLIEHYLKKASDKGHIYAMYYYGLLLYEKDDSPSVLRDAAHYIKISADNGNMEAKAQYGIMLIHGKGISINYEEAAKYLKESTNHQNNPDAFFGLGYLYENGKGVEKDDKKAYQYYKLSAKYKSTDALLRLGNDYFDGQIDGVNIPLAKYCFSSCIKLINNDFVNAAKAIENSYRSFNNLGLIDICAYKDPDNAKLHFGQASLNGYPFAQNNYGVVLQFYFNEIEEAKKMFIEASRINYSLFEYNIAYLYESEGDYKKALEFYILTSEHEKEPLIFRRQTIFDLSVELSKLIVVFLTNIKLVRYYLTQNPVKYNESKQYFIKSLLTVSSFIQLFRNHNQNNGDLDEFKLFFKFKDMIINYMKYISVNIDEFDLKIVENEKDDENFAIFKDLLFKGEENIIDFDPNQLFVIIASKDINRNLFLNLINEIVKKTMDVLYTPPYYIFFGQILFKNNIKNAKSILSEKDVDQNILNELGFEQCLT